MDFLEKLGKRANVCCLCGRPLRSSKIGVGPGCLSKLEEDASFESLDEFFHALETVHLPKEMRDGIVRNKESPLSMCKILTYWASANYSNIDCVMDCSYLMRMAGFSRPAEAIELHRSTIHLKSMSPSSWRVRVPLDSDFIREIRELGVSPSSKSSWWVEWIVSKSEIQKIEALLKFYFSGKRAAVDGGVFGITISQSLIVGETSEDEVQEILGKRLKRNFVGPRVSLHLQGEFLTFSCPWNQDWMHEFKSVVPEDDRNWVALGSPPHWKVKGKHFQTMEVLALKHFQ